MVAKVEQTWHYKERLPRQIAMYEIGYGKPYKVCYVNRNHVKGEEVHVITTTGIVMIFNRATMKHITDLIARPGQLRRYGIEDEWLLLLAKKHQEAGLNNL